MDSDDFEEIHKDLTLQRMLESVRTVKEAFNSPERDKFLNDFQWNLFRTTMESSRTAQNLGNIFNTMYRSSCTEEEIKRHAQQWKRLCEDKNTLPLQCKVGFFIASMPKAMLLEFVPVLISLAERVVKGYGDQN